MAPSGSLVSVDAANVVVEVVKEADDGSGALVIRLYEAWGRRGPVTVSAPWPIGRATVTDLLERHLEEIAAGDVTVTLTMTPFQITTIKLVRAAS